MAPFIHGLFTAHPCARLVAAPNLLSMALCIIILRPFRPLTSCLLLLAWAALASVPDSGEEVHGAVRGIRPDVNDANVGKQVGQHTGEATGGASTGSLLADAKPMERESGGITLGHHGGIGPAWTRGDKEKPLGDKDMGGWKMAVYTPEQQQRLGVDEHGTPVTLVTKDGTVGASVNEVAWWPTLVWPLFVLVVAGLFVLLRWACESDRPKKRDPHAMDQDFNDGSSSPSTIPRRRFSDVAGMT